MQLSKLRQSLDTVRQALKIESSDQDAELEVLINKWKHASRDAAEEVFRGAKDRVNKMGGVGAWRERSQKKPDGWNDDEPVGDDELTKDQKEQREIQREEMQAEIDKYGLGKEPEKLEEKDDESFTMDMMLKQLNIELDVVGYDKEAQRWVD